MSANLQIEQELTSELAQGRHPPRNPSHGKSVLEASCQCQDPGRLPGQDPARNLMLVLQILLTGAASTLPLRAGWPECLAQPVPCETSAFHLHLSEGPAVQHLLPAARCSASTLFRNSTVDAFEAQGNGLLRAAQ